MRTAFIAMFLCIASIAYGQPKPERGVSSKPPQETKTDERGTEKAPLIVKTLTPPKSKEETDREAKEREEKSALERATLKVGEATLEVNRSQLSANVWQTVFNFFLLATTGISAFITWRAANAARMSAEANMLQARAMVSSQVPVVAWVQQKLVGYDTDLKPSIDPAPPGLPPIIHRPVAVIRNGGPTTALFWRFAIKTEVAKKLPDVPHYGGMHRGESFIVEKGQVQAFTSQEIFDIEREQMDAIGSGAKHLWMYGFLTYADFLDEMHEIGFCFRWDLRKGFVMEGPERYIYHQHEKSYTRQKAA